MGVTLEEKPEQLTLDLTVEEQTELALCESVIEQGRKVFLEVGGALMTIQEKRLYRATHTTFETYCREKWEISRSYAYEMIAAFGISENVQNSGHSALPGPANMAQALALRNVPEEEQPEVYREAVETAPDGKPTAAHIEAVANKHLGRPEPETPTPADTSAEPDEPAEKLSESPAETPEAPKEQAPTTPPVKDTRSSQQPTTPPATPTKHAEPTRAEPVTSNCVQHSIPQEEDDWLWENNLTAATAIAELRQARAQLYNASMALQRPQLTLKAEKALSALLERRNSRFGNEPVTASVLLETILMVRCEEAKITLDDTEDDTESEETDDEQ